ncbi:MAG: hypothetical protein WBC06_16635, partial [Chitinophagaceae bacterium]
MKKIKPPESKAGIWLDQKRAFIVIIEGSEEPLLIKIESEVESRVYTPGEARGAIRLDSTFIDDQERKQRRQRNEFKRFFKEIISYLHKADYIFIFGPGQAKEGLKNAIEENHHYLKGTILNMESADKMTQKMIVQKTITFFGTEEFKLF